MKPLAVDHIEEIHATNRRLRPAKLLEGAALALQTVAWLIREDRIDEALDECERAIEVEERKR